MIADVFIVTFDRDSEWFRWSTASIEKYLNGYRKIVAVAPIQDRKLFDPIAADRPTLRMLYIPDWPGVGYYWQQWVKMTADTFTDADLIIHVDSDVMVKAPCSISDLFIKGAPAWLWAYYSELDNACVWKGPTERASGMACDREFMQGFPFAINRRTYEMVRQWIHAKHGIQPETYIRKVGCEPTGPAFSEFNFMGRIAWEFQQELYTFLDRNREEWPKATHCFRQFWSHAPIAECMPEIKRIMGSEEDSRFRLTTEGVWVLNGDTHISTWVEYQKRLDFDRENLKRQCSYIKAGDTVVDVGAFIGDNTIAYARATAGVDSGQVIAFEPNPTAFEALRRNMLSAGSHVQCINAGLSDSEGEMSISTDPNAGASHLTEGTGVPVKKLDDWNLPRLSFLKIDAEGMECRVLAGAGETIMRCRPVMFIEVNQGALERAGGSSASLRRAIEGLGYTVDHWPEGEQFDVLCEPVQ